MSCAEHAFALMLMLARRLDVLSGLVTVERIEANRARYRPFDRRHTPGGNIRASAGLRALHGATIGIIGLGEIGREIAMRAKAFAMRVLYHQRSRVPEGEERELDVTPCAARDAAGGKRLDHAAAADRAFDARSDRPRRVGARSSPAPASSTSPTR